MRDLYNSANGVDSSGGSRGRSVSNPQSMSMATREVEDEAMRERKDTVSKKVRGGWFTHALCLPLSRS